MELEWISTEIRNLKEKCGSPSASFPWTTLNIAVTSIWPDWHCLNGQRHGGNEVQTSWYIREGCCSKHVLSQRSKERKVISFWLQFLSLLEWLKGRAMQLELKFHYRRWRDWVAPIYTCANVDLFHEVSLPTGGTELGVSHVVTECGSSGRQAAITKWSMCSPPQICVLSARPGLTDVTVPLSKQGNYIQKFPITAGINNFLTFVYVCLSGRHRALSLQYRWLIATVLWVPVPLEPKRNSFLYYYTDFSKEVWEVLHKHKLIQPHSLSVMWETVMLSWHHLLDLPNVTNCLSDADKNQTKDPYSCPPCLVQ